MAKTFVKEQILKFFSRVLDSEELRLKLADKWSDMAKERPPLTNIPSPYAATTNHEQRASPANRSDIVFITSRFRSGSTLLWNLFRQIEGTTAYYEPFNERKWFSAASRGNNVDSTHVGVNDYWKEFDGMDDLTELFDERWIHANLHMNRHSWDPKMKGYINQLITRAKGRPVLQFNRIDFRLEWLRHHYPNAKFVHLYRHPRDQWLSFLTEKTSMTKDNVSDTYKDGFYLDMWCKDLAHLFPFLSKKLTPHPYQRFYYLWKLSFLYGKHYCDISIAFEELTHNKTAILERLSQELSLRANLADLKKIIQQPKLDRWTAWADENWFKQLEQQCENNLQLFLG